MITKGYEQLDSEVVAWAKSRGYQDRIVSLDLETKVVGGRFLSGETILGASVSRRVNGSVKTEVYVLEEETAESEAELLAKLDQLMLNLRPVIVVGFNHRGYDGVLLSTKHRSQNARIFWGIRDMLERAYMLDVIHASRFAIAERDNCSPKMMSLQKVIEHPMFANLPMRRTKCLLNGCSDKGAQIYSMWKNDRNDFISYAAGDSHDTLLIFEEIFRNQLAKKRSEGVVVSNIPAVKNLAGLGESDA